MNKVKRHPDTVLQPVIYPVCYFPPGPRLPYQQHSITGLWCCWWKLLHWCICLAKYNFFLLLFSFAEQNKNAQVCWNLYQGQSVEQVQRFRYCGSLITEDGHYVW